MAYNVSYRRLAKILATQASDLVVTADAIDRAQLSVVPA